MSQIPVRSQDHKIITIKQESSCRKLLKHFIMSNTSNIKYFAIYPAIGIARIGNSKTDCFIGPEEPGNEAPSPKTVHIPKKPDNKVSLSDPSDDTYGYKDANKKVKPQAARFRIFGYDENKQYVKELTVPEYKDSLEVKWTVKLGNKKPSHQFFGTVYGRDQDYYVRNAGWPYDRKTLEAEAEGEVSSREIGGIVELSAKLYRTPDGSSGYEGNQKVVLGKIWSEGLSEDHPGSLLVIGGLGESGTVKKGCPITDYANNDYWYDDIADGSIEATVTFSGSPLNPVETNHKSWVIVGPPKFTPWMKNIVSLYQIIMETQGQLKGDITPVYERDIRPIFEAVCNASWVNESAFKGHGFNKPGHFLKEDLEKNLKNNSNDMEPLRMAVFSRVRKPLRMKSTSSYEKSGQAYEYFMPALSGDGGDLTASNPETFLTVTPVQYALLQNWAKGNFTIAESDQNTNSIMKPESLNQGALEWCVGGAFEPGIEMTFIAYDADTFLSVNDEPYRLCRINHEKYKPGDITANMALPWQADFFECSTNWWPLQRPDIVIPEKTYNYLSSLSSITLESFQSWTRGFRQKNTDGPLLGDMDMVNFWSKLGFVVPREIENTKLFVETERNNIYNQSINTLDIDKVDKLLPYLQLALFIELSTIPPYLYAMYSVRGGNIGEDVKSTIRHIVGEEMLHASLVANLIAAIGKKPIFYSSEMFPTYPNTIPHFDPSQKDPEDVPDHIKEGDLLIQLRRADLKTLKLFRMIEAPEQHRVRGGEDENDGSDTYFRSIGELYNKISNVLEMLNVEKWDTTYQLDSSMGYSPKLSDSKGGLKVITNIDDAKAVIKEIREQGEGNQGEKETEKSHYERFDELVKEIEGMKPIDEYRLWPVVDNPTAGTYEDPNLKLAAKAFDISYSYLMLILQWAWAVETKQKRNLILGGMPVLMHGVLKPIATFMAELPVSSDTNAGATFGYVEFASTPTPKQQVQQAMNDAAKAFPNSNVWQTVLKTVDSLPDVAMPSPTNNILP